jgi:hypothetical protein
VVIKNNKGEHRLPRKEISMKVQYKYRSNGKYYSKTIEMELPKEGNFVDEVTLSKTLQKNINGVLIWHRIIWR